jgi:hypothetical protein
MLLLVLQRRTLPIKFIKLPFKKFSVLSLEYSEKLCSGANQAAPIPACWRSNFLTKFFNLSPRIFQINGVNIQWNCDVRSIPVGL